LELKISTDLSLIPQKIEFNADELKTQLSQKLGHYNNLVVTEDAVKEARSDRAMLNKFKNVMESRRKEIKAACIAPYDSFKRQYDEVLAMIQKPIDTIDKQIRAFDDKRKDEKLQAITDFWNEYVGDCKAYVTFKQVFNPKWLNATFPIGDIHSAIMAAFIRVENDVKTIRGLNSGFETEALEEYAATNNVSDAINKIHRLEERRKDELAKSEKAQKIIEDTKPALLHPAASQNAENVDIIKPEASEQTFTLDFRVTATASQLMALKSFLKNNKITYGRAPERN